MAPDPEPPKRKRGRPSNASKTASASLDHPDDYEADVEEPRPKKRGRPKKSLDEPEPEPAPPEEDKPRRGRGRPSLTAAAKPTNEPEEPAPPKRKRGRPSLEKQRKGGGTEERPDDQEPEEAEDAEREAQEGEQPEETRPQRKRGRKRAQAEKSQPEAEPEPEATPEEAPRKKRGRRAQPAQKPPQEEEAEVEVEEEEGQPLRKRSRRSLRDIPHEDANNKGSKAGRSKKGGKQPERADDAENQEESQPRKRGRTSGGRNSTGQKDKQTRPRRSRGEEQDQKPDQEQQEAAPKPKGRRRRSSQTAPPSDADDDAPPSPPKPYLHVASQTRRIRSSTIAAKWSPLSGASIPAASAVLAVAHQPILQRTAATRQRRQHAEAALHLVSRRVSRKLARGMPFPPASVAGGGKPGRPFANADGGRAAELDFESVLDGRAALERQLGPALHAVELLRRERARMERELEHDYDALRKLENSARAQTRERNELLKKAHVLAPTSRPTPQEARDRSIITTSDSSGNVFKNLADPDLQPLALQLAGHVDSIRGNLQQGDGITPQLARTRAALQDVLMRYLDQEAYGQVILG
ncbi:CENP-Q, a CENPA-CAD centromere complex subunit-domain-containing protein [Ilyonectria destructans]|nr:CENP-Q, a CENPA-CAD centromere complex subunit-domain-containing protein [Ilyonectria destructans]